MDILFTEEVGANPKEDELFAASVSRSQIAYLPFYFLEDKVSTYPELEALLSKDITISVEDAASALKVGVDSLKPKFLPVKRYVMDKAMKEIMRQNPDISIDDLFAEIEGSKGWFLFPPEEGYMRDNFQSQKLARLFANSFAINYDKPDISSLPVFEMLNAPVKEYIQSMKGSGYVNAEPDPDGVMRRLPLFIKYEDSKIFPQLAVAGLLDFLKVKDIEIKKESIILKGVVIENKTKDIVIPLDETGAMIVNWTGKWETCFRHIPYYFILNLQETRKKLSQQLSQLSGKELTEEDKGIVKYLENAEYELKEKLKNAVEGKICIVGLTATGTQDLGPIPLQTNYPLVGLSSNLIDTIMTESFIRKAHWALNVLIFFFTALIIGLSSLFRLWRSLLLGIFYYALFFLFSFLALVKWGIWVDMVGPTGILIFGFTAITSFRFFTEQKEKFWIKHAFSHYLSGEVINELMADPSKLKLGGERKNLTVIFSDVRGFTKFSESHQPEEVVAMLNEILTSQVEVVFKYNGTLDKFVGDELMAFFGAPGETHINDHAIIAVRVAVEIQAKLKMLQEKWVQENKEPLKIGIGINTGDAVVGNMGSSDRMDYTIIGDNVNLAARLCAAAGGDEILISEATYEQVKEQIKAERLEPIMVKGKSQPISIYKVTGLV
jgi:adenylate cyclase